MGVSTVPLLGEGAAAEVPGTPLRGGVFVLANTILGAGMLGLPFAFAACGFLIGPMMLAAFACCSITALVLLSECADQVGRPATFNSVAEKAIPGSGLAISLAVAIKCFGVATSYLIVIGDSVPKSVVALGGSGFLVRRQVWTLAALAIAAPLAYMKKITALRNVSLVALGCVLGITIMIICFAIFRDSEANGIFDPALPLELWRLVSARPDAAGYVVGASLACSSTLSPTRATRTYSPLRTIAGHTSAQRVCCDVMSPLPLQYTFYSADRDMSPLEPKFNTIFWPTIPPTRLWLSQGSPFLLLSPAAIHFRDIRHGRTLRPS